MLSRKTWVFALVTVLMFAGASFAAVGSDLVGTYSGVFTGPENNGAFIITVNPDGSINGTGHSQVLSSDLTIEGTVQPDGTANFYTVNGADIPIYFKGRIDFMNRLLGKWSSQDNNAWGSFNAMIQ